MASPQSSSSVTTKNHEKAFAAYLKDRRIVVADASASSRSNLISALKDLGAHPANIAMANTFEDAESFIARNKPQIIICDYELGKRCGLDLLQKQRAEQPDSRSCLFIMVTGNTSQTAVARAAEEDVDGYILKPFTAASLRTTLMRTAIAKISPTPYVKMVEEGKAALAEAKLDQAGKIFEAAKALSPAPSLACFYLGQVHLLKQAMDNAEIKYAEGLEFNKIHYKCLVGLYDVLMSQKRYNDAYNIVKKISQYFPANPQRLTSVLKLAIFTKSYDDVERYYQMFTRLDERSEEVIKYVCAALVVCGKYYLMSKVPSRAMELFRKAAINGAGRPKVLQEIILTLVEANMAGEADEFLKRFPADQQLTPMYKALDLLLFDRVRGIPSLTIEKGRKLLQDGVQDPVIYQIAIQRSAEEGLNDVTEDLVFRGGQQYPDQKEKFERIAATGRDLCAQRRGEAAVPVKSPA